MTRTTNTPAVGGGGVALAGTLQGIVARRGAILAERRERTESHTAFLAASAGELAQLREAEALIVGGLDLGKIERARRIITIEGKVGKATHSFDGYSRTDRSQVRPAALADAKADIAAGGAKIRRHYFGVKNYSGFGDQREDHEYGMGPRHGSIVFSIGLRRDFRKALASDAPLTAEQIDDALYLLSALPKIEELQAEQVPA